VAENGAGSKNTLALDGEGGVVIDAAAPAGAQRIK
jgi:hypothetical protein